MIKNSKWKSELCYRIPPLRVSITVLRVGIVPESWLPLRRLKRKKKKCSISWNCYKIKKWVFTEYQDFSPSLLVLLELCHSIDLNKGLFFFFFFSEYDMGHEIRICIYRTANLVKFPKSVGIVPFNRFELRFLSFSIQISWKKKQKRKNLKDVYLQVF